MFGGPRAPTVTGMRWDAGFPSIAAVLSAGAVLGGTLVAANGPAASAAVAATGPDAIAAKKKPRGAKPKARPVSGRLSRPGYTVIAIGANGDARSTRARGGHFKLRPPAMRFTLQLRGPDGRYAGPVVVGSDRRGRRAILGIRAGAKLGKIKVKRGRGYARLRRPLARKWADPSRSALARHGVPIGAGNFGLVRSHHAHGGLPGDTDLDGVPDTIDIDDDGDLILDNYDRSTIRRTTQGASNSSPPIPLNGLGLGQVTTDLGQGEIGVVNVNGGSTDAEVAATQASNGRIGLGWLSIDPGTGELNCGTLVYCSAGGTGRLDTGSAPRSQSPPFPECCDPDADGLGTLTVLPPAPGFTGFVSEEMGGMSLYHGATQDQIRAGDVLIVRGLSHGTVQEAATSVGFVFSTLPALAAYGDGQGDSAQFTYPAQCPSGPVPNVFCPQPVRAGPGGDVTLTLTLWRPQRRHIAGDPGEGEWMDVGNLAYATAVVPAFAHPLGTGTCPAGDYSALDANLTPAPPSPFVSGPMLKGGAAFVDLGGDQPSNPANTVSFTLNVSDCMASTQGAPPSTSEPFNVNFSVFSLSNLGTIESMASSSAPFQLQP